jgi:hypothetical protein
MEGSVSTLQLQAGHWIVQIRVHIRVQRTALCCRGVSALASVHHPTFIGLLLRRWQPSQAFSPLVRYKVDTKTIGFGICDFSDTYCLHFSILRRFGQSFCNDSVMWVALAAASGASTEPSSFAPRNCSITRVGPISKGDSTFSTEFRIFRCAGIFSGQNREID